MNNASNVSAFEKAAAARNRQETPKAPPPFSIRFTLEERVRLNREAGNHSLSAHIRKKLFGQQIAPRKGLQRRPGVDDAALAKALSALGQSRLAPNMNQLAKAANIGRVRLTPASEAQLQQACADIAAMRRDLMKALGLKAE